MINKLLPSSPFTDRGRPLNFSILDFWQFRYSNIFDLQEYIAEFIVAKALGIDNAMNADGWTLFDMEYKTKRIEVKETSYFHSWQGKICKGKISSRRSFDIHKAYVKYKDSSSVLDRNCDIYVFCLNTGNTAEESNPMQMENWQFYVVPTSIINEKCKDNKTISLSRVRSIAKACTFAELREEVEKYC